MLPFTVVALGVVAVASSSAVLIDPPTAGQRRLVSYGPYGKPVNETAVAGTKIDGVPYLMAVWQFQEPPGTNEIESFTSRLHYAIGSFHPTTGALSWTEIDDMPQPADHVTRDPAVATLLGSDIITQSTGGFVGAGVAIDETEEVESAFIALTEIGDTEFVPFQNGFEFDCCDACSEDAIVRNTRLGSWITGGTTIEPVSALLAR